MRKFKRILFYAGFAVVFGIVTGSAPYPWNALLLFAAFCGIILGMIAVVRDVCRSIKAYAWEALRSREKPADDETEPTHIPYETTRYRRL